MNSNFQNPFADSGASDAAGCNAEETLGLIAHLPAPEGLEDRIHERLQSAPRRGPILAWPAPAFLSGDWMRAAAAAALAFVVAGGGWGVYSRVQHGQPAKAIAMPAHVAAPGSFSSAGAMRTPQTLNGPVLTHPVKAHSSHKTTRKTAARGAPASRQSGAAGKIAVPPAAPRP